MRTESHVSEATYQRHLPQLTAGAGRFALVKGVHFAGVFPTHAAAAAAWLLTYGPVPALTLQVGPGGQDPSGSQAIATVPAEA